MGKGAFSKRLRILHVVDHFGEGGSQELLCEMVRLHDKDRIDIAVVALFRPHGKYNHEHLLRKMGVPIYVLSNRRMLFRKRNGWQKIYGFIELIIMGLFFPVLLWRFSTIAQKEHSNIIHAHFLFAYPLAVVVGKSLNLKVVFTIPALRSQMDSYSKLIFPFYRLLARQVDHFFTALPGDKPADYFHIAQDKVSAFLGVVDIAKVRIISREMNPLIKEFGLNARVPVLLSIGRFDAEKGHDYTIRMFLFLHQKVPNAHLFILGEGPTHEDCMKIVQQAQSAEFIHLPGFRADIEHFFSLSTIFIRSFLFEGMNTSIQWAMAYGKPIVAFDNKSPSEILVHQKTGILVPLKDIRAMEQAVGSLLEDAIYADALGKEAKYFIEEHANIYKSVKIFEEKYYSLKAI
jgi:glycosyltransferase involved in cell wall biosynthesis